MRTKDLSALTAAVLAAFAATAISAQSFEDSFNVPGDEDPVYAPRPNGVIVPPNTRIASVNETAATACAPEDAADMGRIGRTLTGINNRSLDPAIVFCGAGTDFRSDNNGEIREFGVYLTNSGPAPIIIECTAAKGRGVEFQTSTKSRTVNPTPPGNPQLLFWKAVDFGGTPVRYPIVVKCTLPTYGGVHRIYAEFPITHTHP